MVVQQVDELVEQDPPQRRRVPLLDPRQPVQQPRSLGPVHAQRAQHRSVHMGAPPGPLDAEDPVEHAQMTARGSQEFAQVA